MTPKKGPVFVHRGTYRRRRVADAARLLPLFGGILVLIPLLWGRDEAGDVRTAGVMFYFFLIWVLLAVLAGVVSRFLRDEDSTIVDEDGES